MTQESSSTAKGLKEQLDAFRQALLPQSKQFIDKNLAISSRLQQLLEAKGWTQKYLALRMDCKESQVSRWLSAQSNITLRSLAELEVALGADVITIPETEHADGKHYVMLRVPYGPTHNAQPHSVMSAATDGAAIGFVDGDIYKEKAVADHMIMAA